MLSILIAHGDNVVRSGLRSILDAQESWSVVAEAAEGREAIGRALETRPNVAIVDWALPLVNGIGVTRRVRACLPATEVLMVGADESELPARELLEAGARGFLLTSNATTHLVAAVETLATHKPFFTNAISEALLGEFLTNRPTTEAVLTRRQRTIVQLVAQGHTNKTISEMLNLSQKTIEAHRAAVLHRLNLSGTAALVRYAIRANLVDP